MRFRRLRALVFGPLRECDLDLAADVVLVFGPNESGKSTFRSALETLLYGFDPATREAHPLHGWDGGSAGDLHLEAELELTAGEMLCIERVLQATGKSRTARKGESFEGKREGNAALSQVRDLPRELYRSLYSLELEQLDALRESVQSHVDDLLLPEAEALDLRPVSEIRRQLAEDQRALWRADRRGRPRAQRLRDELRAARVQVAEAAREEQSLRDARIERDELEARLDALLERKRIALRARHDAPYLEQLFELYQHKRRLGPPVGLSPLGGLPLVAPRDLEAEIAELEEQLHEPTARLARKEEGLEESQRAALEAASEVEFALAAAPQQRADGTRLAEVQRRSESLERSALRELTAVLDSPARARDLESAGALPLEALRAVHTRWASAWARYAESPALAGRPPVWTLTAGLAGLTLVALGAFSVLDVRLAVAGALLTFGALLAAFFGGGARARRSPTPPARPRDLDAALGSLRVASGLLRGPSEAQRLLECCERVRGLLAEREEADTAARRLRAGLERREARWAELCSRLGLDADGEGEQRVARLRATLEAARERERQVAGDRSERELARRSCESLAPSLERKRDHRRRLEQVLRAAEPGGRDLGEAHDGVVRRLREAHFVREREAELREDSRWGTYERDSRVRVDTPPEDADWRPEIAGRRDDEIAELDDRIAAANERIGELNERIAGDAGSQQAQAADAVDELEEKLRAVERERDRLALLESAIARAERSYRERRQPDVLCRATTYLERVTHGRYTRLEYLSASEGGLHVQCVDRAEPLRVGPPISRGTLDQTFLCLRLGLLDHLDEDRERLPLVLDDALARCDGARRRELYELLAEVARVRQVFLLTCHETLAREAERALKVRRLELAP